MQDAAAAQVEALLLNGGEADGQNRKKKRTAKKSPLTSKGLAGR
jgi:hypothetical protein